MSADLLAEFDSYYSAKSSSQAWALNDVGNHRQTNHQAGDGPKKSSSSAFVDTDDQNPWIIQGGLSTRHGDQGQAVVVEDNDWGDFEDGRSTAPSFMSAKVPAEDSRLPQTPSPAFDPWGSVEDFTVPQGKPGGIQVDDRLNVSQSEAGVYFPRPQPLFQPSNTKPATPSNKSIRSSLRLVRDENVLFDADDVTDDDDEGEDFGDFTVPEVAPSVPTPIAAQKPVRDIVTHASLIDLDDETTSVQPEVSLAETQRTPSSFQATTPVPGFDPFGDLDTAFGSGSAAQQRVAPINQAYDADRSGDSASRACSKSKQDDKISAVAASRTLDSTQRPTKGFTNTPAVQDEIYDAWGDWEDQESVPQTTDAKAEPSTRLVLDLPPLLTTPRNISQVAPTNVPPPALLLSIFPTLIEGCQTKLLKPLAAVSQTDRDIILSGSDVHDFLHSYLVISTVLARIIAGRRLRWKRDTLLAQSMCIGQAGAKTTGMKLASLDKSEDTREEREVINVVRLWKLQAGKLRTTLIAAGISATVPEIAETLPVRTGQASEGAITAPKQCALCAIKRDERVHKTDSDVQDSFGEYWIEHWGHRSCKDFWDSKEQDLRSR